jgi:two-component system response regulator MtrA
VVATVDGRYGMRMFRYYQADITRLDIRMPILSGLDVCTLIPNESDIPIIMFSAVDEREDVVAAIQRGANDYVLKGSGVAAVSERISR